jgi:hypothetical protein
VTATKEEIGLHADALAQAHSVDDFVAAAERLAAKLDEDDRAVLQILLGPEAAQPIVLDLLRRLHAEDAPERIAAMAALARIGDRTALPFPQERADAAELAEERDAVRALEAASR